MKKALKIVLIVFGSIGLLIGILYFTGNGYLARGIYCTYLHGKIKPDIDDQSFFDTRKINRGEAINLPAKLKVLSNENVAFLNSTESEAFLVFKNDTLVSEWYGSYGADSTHWNSFSMAKSVISLLIGCALEDGKISSLQDPISKYIPWSGNDVTLEQLLHMSSGIPFGESYSSPFGYMAKAYYHSDLKAITTPFKVEQTPGSYWSYEGGNTVLLGMALEAATQKKISNYFEEKIWTKIGAASPTYWNLDTENGFEKPFTGIYATAKDFGMLGQCILHHGKVNGQEIIDSTYLAQSFEPWTIQDGKNSVCHWYGLHWWMGEVDGVKFKSARGMRGQYIVIIPEKNMVVVRIGHQQSKERINQMPVDMLSYIRMGLAL
ncbi:MAG: beta-lactamase family protein [Flavobacteriales bacterium]|nr:beta-lactamase family protein [Flavobacteriales bacterium]MDP4717321.1 beta-lactamase family protein [Flavobacteriales bacterium]MDP4731024.1 beta-lactamase family protein [Flavobacteriales bacterium]MDP4818656.1 beta-lactamase family protein [Flavobacteriales bacterium]MDP5075119.1 beta-lactamase family protein [Flavobacteriales bacterium]